MPIVSPRATAGSAGAGRNIPLHAFSGAPLSWASVTEYLRMMAKIVNGILDGKINATGSVTLTANAATTTLSDRRIGADSVIGFTPLTANAKAEGIPYVTAQVNETATLNHNNNAQSDRDYRTRF